MRVRLLCMLVALASCKLAERRQSEVEAGAVSPTAHGPIVVGAVAVVVEKSALLLDAEASWVELLDDAKTNTRWAGQIKRDHKVAELPQGARVRVLEKGDRAVHVRALDGRGDGWTMAPFIAGE